MELEDIIYNHPNRKQICDLLLQPETIDTCRMACTIIHDGQTRPNHLYHSIISLLDKSIPIKSNTFKQQNITDRKRLGAFYTSSKSAELLTNIILPKNNKFYTDINNIQNIKIADFACGTGILLYNTYKELIKRFKSNNIDLCKYHSTIMKNLIGFDVLPGPAYLCVSALSSLCNKPYSTTSIGVAYINTPNNIGSLNQIDELHSLTPYGYYITSNKPIPYYKSIPNNSIDYIIMNPPYTGNTIGDEKSMFSSFGLSKVQQLKLSKLVNKKFKGTCTHGNAGYSTNYLYIAHQKLKPGGKMAFILPSTLCLGDSWKNVRKLLTDNYNDIHIYSIADITTNQSSFSDDTNMAEIILYCTKGSSTNEITFHTINKDHKETNKHTIPINHTWCLSNVYNTNVIDILYKIRKLPITKMSEICKFGPLLRDIGSIKKDNIKDRNPLYISDTGDIGIVYHNDHTRDTMIISPDMYCTLYNKSAKEKYEYIKNTKSHLHFNQLCRFTSQSNLIYYTKEKTLGGMLPTISTKPEFEKALTVWFNSTLGIFMYWLHAGKQQFGRGLSSRSALKRLPVLDFNVLYNKLEQFNDIFDRYSTVSLSPITHLDKNRRAMDLEICDILDINYIHEIYDILNIEPSFQG